MSEFTLDVIIEIPRGSRNKYEYDKEKKMVRLDRMLYPAMHYPTDYGFIPDTLALDGDPLDVCVVIWEPTFPGCLVEVKPIGMLKMWDDKGKDEKIIAVPADDPHYNHCDSLADMPSHLLLEIENFFATYKVLEKKQAGIDGWEDTDAAVKIIKECFARYEQQ